MRGTVPRARTAIVLLSLLAAAVVLGGCDGSLSTGLSHALTGPPPASVVAGASTASTALGTLRIAPDGPLTGYSRAEFGDGWARQADGCTSRVDALLRHGTDITRTGCKVTAGRWYSAYDGITLTAASLAQIDHLVPLAEAWRTGAAGWSPVRRVAFANDVDRELLPVSIHANESKGDGAPPAWEPQVTDRCEYAQQWITI